MLLKTIRLGAMMVCALTSVTVAQNPGDADPPGERPARERREGRAPRPIGRLGNVDAQVEIFTEQLRLDEVQQKQARELFEAQQQKVREIHKQNARSPEEIEAWKKLQVDMNEAMKAQDQAKLNELRQLSDQMRKDRQARLEPARQQIKESETALHDSMMNILRPDQREKFEAVWTEHITTRTRRAGPVRSPRALKALVDRVPDLSSEQKKQIDAYFDEFKRSMGKPPEQPTNGEGPGRTERASRRKVMQERLERLYSNVLSVMTPEQKAFVESRLRGRERREGGRPGGREERRANDEELDGGESRP